MNGETRGELSRSRRHLTRAYLEARNEAQMLRRDIARLQDLLAVAKADLAIFCDMSRRATTGLCAEKERCSEALVQLAFAHSERDRLRARLARPWWRRAWAAIRRARG